MSDDKKTMLPGLFDKPSIYANLTAFVGLDDGVRMVFGEQYPDIQRFDVAIRVSWNTARAMRDMLSQQLAERDANMAKQQEPADGKVLVN